VNRLLDPKSPASADALAMCAALPQGGIAHYSYALASALQATGLNTTVLMYDEPEYDLSAYPHSHTALRNLKFATSWLRRVTDPLWNLAAIMHATMGRQVVHFQWSLGPRNDRLVWQGLHAAGKRIVYTAHDVIPHEAAIMPLSHAKWVYQHADALIVHGDSLKALLLENFSVEAAKVQVVAHGNYNFVADTPGVWDRTSARASLGFTENDRVVLFFGLIREYKGLELLIDAFKLLNERGLPDRRGLKLLIAGRSFNGHWEDGAYEARIREAGLSNLVSLQLRHIPLLEVARFFHAADVVAVPYRRGSQSGVLQLCYSFGKAAVATRVGSLAEGLSSKVTRFVEPNDPSVLAAALFELLADPLAAQLLGAQARAYADDDLGWGPIARRTRAIYDELR
jgi:D-inositol-3-phosphate glycosyltransferase